MKKKVLTLALAIIAMISFNASAQEFIKLGERPIYENYRKADAKVIDPYENELYGDSEKISEEEWFSTTSYERMSNPLFPYNGSVWENKPSAFNDGIQCLVKSEVNADWGEEVMYEAYKDVNGKTILKDMGMPGGMYSTIDYHHYYNFGYFTESLYESSAHYSDEHVFEDGYRFVFSTITNAVTGEVYKVDDVLFNAIDNNGNIYFATCIAKGGKEEQVYYKAKLKKHAVISVYMDGEKIAFDQIPYAENGRTLVPLRAIFEKLGATVEWNGDTNTITATKGSTTVTLTLDNTSATKNGEAVTLDVPAKAVGGRTLVPVRFVSDCFGVDVQWDEPLKKVVLTSK